MQRSGWEVHLITLHGSLLGGRGVPVNFETGLGRRLIKNFAPRSIWSTIKDVRYQRLNQQFYRLLKQNDLPRPHAIIDYNFYFNDAAIRFGSENDIPVVLNFESFVCDSMIGPNLSMLKLWGRRFERQKYLRATRMMTVSEPLAAALYKDLGPNPPPIDIVPNAVDLRIAQPAATVIPSLRQHLGIPPLPVVGFVGALSPWYSLDELVNACNSISRAGARFHLMIIGDGPERPRLLRMLEKASFSYSLPGVIPHREIFPYIACFDVAVITNHKWWTSPLKLLEYGAMGRAVLAPAMASIKAHASADQIELFEPGNWAQLRCSLAQLLQDNVRRGNLGQKLRRHIEQEFSIEQMGARLEMVLRQAIAA